MENIMKDWIKFAKNYAEVEADSMDTLEQFKNGYFSLTGEDYDSAIDCFLEDNNLDGDIVEALKNEFGYEDYEKHLVSYAAERGYICDYDIDLNGNIIVSTVDVNKVNEEFKTYMEDRVWDVLYDEREKVYNEEIKYLDAYDDDPEILFDCHKYFNKKEIFIWWANENYYMSEREAEFFFYHQFADFTLKEIYEDVYDVEDEVRDLRWDGEWIEGLFVYENDSYIEDESKRLANMVEED